MALFSCSESGETTQEQREDSREQTTNPVIAKLEQIVIPQVNIDGATIEEAVDYARICSIQYDPESDVEYRGVSFLERRPRVDPDSEPDGYRGIGVDESAQTRTMIFAASDVPLLDFVGEIARQGALDAYLTSVGIVFVPEGSSPFPNAKAQDGDIWKVLRQSETKEGEQAAGADH